MGFADRVDAGRRLAHELAGLRGADVVVLGLPRGGVPVAAEVATALAAPLDVAVVRKLGVPYQPELAMGAIGEQGSRVLNHEVLQMAAVDPEELAGVEDRERAEVDRRARRYRAGLPAVPLSGRTVVVVDDGLATGSTARAACQVARARGAARVVLAVPVAPAAAVDQLAADADQVVALETPEPFFAVGQWYEHFAQTNDDEVTARLQAAARRVEAPAGDDEEEP